MPDVTCPECGHETELLTIRRSADEFCRHCDYPLFWAPTGLPGTVPGGNSDATLRRLPGAGGRQRIGSKICPVCGELNPLTEIHCIRCTSELDPKPEPEPEPEPEPPPPPPEPVYVAPEPDPEPSWWWFIGSMVGLAVVSVILAIVT